VKVAVIGQGAIGGPVARSLADGEVAGAVLAGVVSRDRTTHTLLETADLVVECAGQRAVAELGPRVIAEGTDLLLVSTGALADERTFRALTTAGTGRVYISSGAIGGLDLLAGAARMGPLRAVRLTTTKRAATLIQPWMSVAEVTRMTAATEPVELMRGPAREVTAAFPASANVAASLALAVGDWDVVEAVVIADPSATMTSHLVTADAVAGHYRFEVRHQPSPEKPTSSAVVPYTVLSAISALAGQRVVIR
jgi:aspartate dehydrogenase